MTDEEQIRQTLARYPQVHDDRNVEGYVALFAHDGRFVSSPNEYVGRPAIKAFIADLYAKAANRQSKHYFGNSVVDIQGDVAHAVTDVVVYHSYDDGPWALAQVNRHIDRLVRQDGTWLFAEKRVELR